MNELAVSDPTIANSGELMLNPQLMSNLLTFADQMSKASITVPDHLRNKPADCLAICFQAAQWRMNPFAVAQKTHIVNGRLGYEAQLVQAVIDNSGLVVPNSWEYETKGAGENLELRCGTIRRGQTTVTWGPFLKLGHVTTRNSPLWKTNPEQQLGYLQVKNWGRKYTPGAILGVYTPDELEKVERVDDDGASAAPPADSRPLMPQRRTPPPPPPADVVDVEPRSPAPPAASDDEAKPSGADLFGGEPAATPPAPAQAARPAQTATASAPAPRPDQDDGRNADGTDDGQLASMGHKKRLEMLAKANDKNLDLVYSQQGTSSERLTVAQFNTIRKVLES